MAISILYLNERKNYVKPISDRILYHLSLDRSFSHICADVKKREYFLSVVSDLTNDKNEILYRQAIIKDFENNPTLLEQLISLSTRFEELRITQKTAGRDEYRLNATGTASSATAKNILQAQALCLKRALLFIKAYGELLEKYELKSDGLKSLYSSKSSLYALMNSKARFRQSACACRIFLAVAEEAVPVAFRRYSSFPAAF